MPDGTVRQLVFVACCPAFLFSLAGCGKPPSKAPAHALPTPPLVSKCEPGVAGGRLALAVPLGPRSFNPLMATDPASDDVVRLLFGSLVNLNWLTQEPGPGLAQSWTVEPDGKTWTFKLRQGLRWSDGKLLTADDVVFTWNDLMYNRDINQYTAELFRIGGKPFEVSKMDELTVRVVTPEVFAPFLEFFGGVSILPRHTLESFVHTRRFAAAYQTAMPPERIVGCGPFRVKGFEAGKFTLLERNPEYWVTDAQGRRLPYFDEVMFTATQPGTDPLVFLNGKSDAQDVVRADMFEQFRQASTNGHFRLVELGIGLEREFLWFNQNTGTNLAGKPFVNPLKLKWFRNEKFRQAISCAIDRERLVREIYFGRAQPIYSFVSSENQKWNNPGVPRFDFDLDRARKLLAEAGIQDRKGNGVAEDADGNAVEFTLYSNLGNPAREQAAAQIRDDLQKLGLKVTYLPIDFKLLQQRVDETYDYECALMGLGGGGIDPASQLNVLKSSEDLHQWFPREKTPSSQWEARIDVLMDAQMRTLDFGTRKKAFDEVQAILAEQLPMIPTVAPFAYAAVCENIGNVRPSALTPYRMTWNLDELFRK